ncbi:LuxR family transcriptional regulator [Rathayibacter sp. VKM Ac-2801]|uniref:ATP-binding protein n=1 Tax=Rathayibacter sp. VKM Ac-2801 TaxID=2609255 RepID=UPI00131F4B4F|nr:LuxR family transcriptional regulator [Rathayibacter sp. VKM Ac-2801]QHC71741.1 AAA family ATPase [Rathayibacter sp. VKM Ac-2801]
MSTPDASPDKLSSARDVLVGSASSNFRLPLRGRGWETGIVDQAIRDVASGESRALLFVGAPGAGKTRLLGEIITKSERLGWRAVVAAPEPESHLLPTAVLVEAALAARPPILRTADVEALTGNLDSRYWLTQAFRNGLESAAAENCVLVVVDDLQWVDSASLAILRSLIATLSDLPILWAFAVRGGEHGPGVHATMNQLLTAGTTVTVEPLHIAAAMEMAADILGARPDHHLETMLSRAENLPLLIAEFAHGLLEEDLVSVDGDVATARADQATLPMMFGSSIRERIAHLPDSTSRTVQVAATLGRAFALTDLAELLEETTSNLIRDVEQAITADILVDGSPLHFRHDAIRETAEAMLSPSIRAHLRRRAADIRLRSGEPLLTVASSVADSANRGDAAAVALLHDAALELAASDAIGAAGLARRALELATTNKQNELLSELVPVLWVGGSPDVAMQFSERVSRVLPLEASARLQLAVARLQTESSFSSAVRTTTAALLIDGVSINTRAQLLAVKALNLANLGDYTRLESTLIEARAAAEAAGEAAALSTVDATESVLRFYENRFDLAADLIETATARMMNLPGFIAAQWLPEILWPAFLANSVGKNREALRQAEVSSDEMRRTRNAVALAFWTMVRCRILFDLGELAEAKLHAENVIAMSEELGLGDFARATAGVVLYRIALVEGDFAACAAQRADVQQMAADPSLRLAGSWLLALTADADGDSEAVLRTTEGAYETLAAPTPSMTTPADFGDDAMLARMWHRSGATKRLQRLSAVTNERALMNPGNTLANAIDSQVHGIATGSVTELERSVALLRQGERPLLLASALEDLGRARLDTEEPQRASEEPWQEAADLYEAHGANRDADRVLKRLRAVGIRRRPKAAADHHGMLSARERQVAERLAQGVTTKQIALDLSVTQNTVITHVRRIYDKWGISSRRALIERVQGERENR